MPTDPLKIDVPRRIQRLRSKGWKMPGNTAYVGRPGKFGNPYSVGSWGLDLAMELFRETVTGGWNPMLVTALTDGQVKTIYALHCHWLKRISFHPTERIRSELRGKNLACWCRLDQKCHADILLEIANG